MTVVGMGALYVSQSIKNSVYYVAFTTHGMQPAAVVQVAVAAWRLGQKVASLSLSSNPPAPRGE